MDDSRVVDKSSPNARHANRQERNSSDGVERRRSRSPRKDEDKDNDRPRRRKDAGFKWKEKRKDDDPQRERETGLNRGYKDQYRPRSRSPRQDDTRDDRRSDRKAETSKPTSAPEKEHGEKKERKEKKAVPVASSEPMIVVYVNDRLGTKKAVPCFASDPIKDFKVIVASMIGRQPHEILLKRQGERPFKDQLTLRDYGVSNNVQLDLEVDTGD